MWIRRFSSPDMITVCRVSMRPSRAIVEVVLLQMANTCKFPIGCKRLRWGGVCILHWLIVTASMRTPMTLLIDTVDFATSLNQLDTGYFSRNVPHPMISSSLYHITQVTPDWDPAPTNYGREFLRVGKYWNMALGFSLPAHLAASVRLGCYSTTAICKGYRPKLLVALSRGNMEAAM